MGTLCRPRISHERVCVAVAMNSFLSSAEAADQLGFTVQHVRRLIKQGDLDGVKIGRDWVVNAASVVEFLQRRENLDLPLTSSAE